MNIGDGLHTALIPHSTVVFPSLAIADPSAVPIESIRNKIQNKLKIITKSILIDYELDQNKSASSWKLKKKHLKNCKST